MLRETLVFTAIQSGILFLALWGIFRLVPSIPANAKAWMWRLAFLKPLLSLLPFAVVTLPILPSNEPVRIVSDESGYVIQPVAVLTQEAAGNAVAPIQEAPAPIPASPTDYLLVAWFAGVIVVASHGAWGMRKAWKVAKGAQPVRDVTLLATFEDLLDRAGVKRRPILLSSPLISGAMLVGGRRYAIVLPESTLANGEHEDLRMMMAHEVAHIARQDLFWFSLVSTVQSLFFFNPMVWIAVRCSRLDHESATDRHASRLAGVSVQTYADMLLRATTLTRPALAPGSLPMAESYRTIHRRLEAMKHFNSKPTFWRRTSTAALAMLTLGMLPAYNLVAAVSPETNADPLANAQTSPVAQPEVSLSEPVALRQVDPKKAAQLKAKKAKLEKELRKKQEELQKLQKELDKASGKKDGPFYRYEVIPANGATISEKDKASGRKDGQFYRYEVSPVSGTTMSEKDARPLSKEYVKYYTEETLPNFKTTSQTNYRVFTTNDNAVSRAYVTSKLQPTWKVADRLAQDNKGGDTWKTYEVPAQTSQVGGYEVSGKNLKIEFKGSSYFVTADGPITIKPISAGKSTSYFKDGRNTTSPGTNPPRTVTTTPSITATTSQSETKTGSFQGSTKTEPSIGTTTTNQKASSGEGQQVFGAVSTSGQKGNTVFGTTPTQKSGQQNTVNGKVVTVYEPASKPYVATYDYNSQSSHPAIFYSPSKIASSTARYKGPPAAQWTGTTFYGDRPKSYTGGTYSTTAQRPTYYAYPTQNGNTSYREVGITYSRKVKSKARKPAPTPKQEKKPFYIEPTIFPPN